MCYACTKKGGRNAREKRREASLGPRRATKERGRRLDRYVPNVSAIKAHISPASAKKSEK